MFARPSGALVVSDAKLTIDTVHPPGVDENQYYENEYGALLSPPETKLETKHRELIQPVNEQNGKAEGHGEPDCEEDENGAQVGVPVGAVIRTGRPCGGWI